MKALAKNGAKFPSLQYIYLDNNKITDDGVKFLVKHGLKFPNLKAIDLHDNQITDAGKKGFR